MTKHAVFLNGPVGAGKTTLGRALGNRLAAPFIDGDDMADHGRPWYASILRTSRAILEAGLAALDDSHLVVIAYPLRCTTWIYFPRHFAGAGIQPFFISLSASYSSIVNEGRGRVFGPEEHERIKIMIAQGYGERDFSDLIVDTGSCDTVAHLERLEGEVRRRCLPNTARGGSTVAPVAAIVERRERCRPIILRD